MDTDLVENSTVNNYLTDETCETTGVDLSGPSSEEYAPESVDGRKSDPRVVRPNGKHLTETFVDINKI